MDDGGGTAGHLTPLLIRKISVTSADSLPSMRGSSLFDLDITGALPFLSQTLAHHHSQHFTLILGAMDVLP